MRGGVFTIPDEIGSLEERWGHEYVNSGTIHESPEIFLGSGEAL